MSGCELRAHQSCQFAVQPASSLDPISANGSWGHCEDTGGFILGESTEEPKLHHLGQPGAQRSEPAESVIELEQRVCLMIGGLQCIVEGYSARATAAPGGLSLAGVIHQHPSHGTRGHREKVISVLPRNLGHVRQAEIGLVHQRRRGKRVPWRLASEVCPRHPAQLVIHHLEEVVVRLCLGCAGFHREDLVQLVAAR